MSSKMLNLDLIENDDKIPSTQLLINKKIKRPLHKCSKDYLHLKKDVSQLSKDLLTTQSHIKELQLKLIDQDYNFQKQMILVYDLKATLRNLVGKMEEGKALNIQNSYSSQHQEEESIQKPKYEVPVIEDYNL